MARGRGESDLGPEERLSGAVRVLHPEVLPEDQRRALARIGSLAAEHGFHMAGGTALALQLGHRRSVDFDWFRAARIGDPLALAADLGVQVRSTSRDTLHAEEEGVHLSFFSYRYPLIRPLIPADEFGCELASLEDIAAMKLAAVSQRGARKDFFDLVALGRAGLGLQDMFDAYRGRFSVSDVGHVIVALTWFDDADSDPEPILDARDTWDDVKATLRSWVRDYANR